ncbi:MAG: hypothetical protein KAT41_06480, partial [Candidatus Marinimicrobia bacterium]|nr:hypothetical protein [Candidatus Neomarinimicrobiota bacterium]
MSEIFMLIEHRQEEIRDISYEMMTCGRALAEKLNTKLTAVFLGYDADKLVESIRNQAHRIMVVDNEVFKEFNAESYQ